LKKLVAIGMKDKNLINDDHYYGKHQHAKVEEILQILGDCKVWIGKSMGKGSIKKLKELNYETVLTDKNSPDGAIRAYLG